jgi:uncharacterized RDD family membrane protein YckC
MLRIETPESVTVTYPIAGIGSRGLAAIIDIGMLAFLLLTEALVVALALYLTMRVLSIDAVGAIAPWAVAGLVVALFLTYWGYYIFGEVFRNGRTVGKRVMRIRVVRDDGSRIGVLDAVVRNVVRIIDIMPGTYAVGIFALVLSPQSKRLGDMAAGTVVIAESTADPLSRPILPAEENAALVADFLSRRVELTPAARWQVACELLAAYDEQPQPGWDEPVLAGRLAQLAGIGIEHTPEDSS